MPRVKDASEDLGELVEEGLQEHHVVEVLMEEMKALEPGSDEWLAKFTVLMENVEHHAEEEESEMFPALRSNLGADVLDALAEELEAGKKRRGAPVLADKIDLTKEQLIELAREQEIPGRSAMDHEELAATVAPTS
ncbi:MAG: hemerythrin domain-containing protein [Acidimicrobiia bacterium]